MAKKPSKSAGAPGMLSRGKRQVVVWLDPDEWALVAGCAAAVGMPTATYSREVLLATARLAHAIRAPAQFHPGPGDSPGPGKKRPRQGR